MRLAGVSACALRPPLGHREASEGRGGGAVSPAAAHPPSRPQTSAPPTPASAQTLPVSTSRAQHALCPTGSAVPGTPRPGVTVPARHAFSSVPACAERHYAPAAGDAALPAGKLPAGAPHP